MSNAKPIKNVGLRNPVIKGKVPEAEELTHHGHRHDTPDQGEDKYEGGRRYKDKGALPKETMMRSMRQMDGGPDKGPTEIHNERFEEAPGTREDHA